MVRSAFVVFSLIVMIPTALAGVAPDLQETDEDATGKVPLRVTSGDLNADGLPDIVVSNSSTQDLSIFFNEGEATFGPELRVPAGGDVRETLIADLDDDGDNDVVALLRTADVAVAVWLTTDPGEFAEPQFYGGPTFFTYSMELIDVNDDDRLDIVFIEGFVDSKLSILHNDGAGAFPDQADIPFEDGVDFSYIFDLAAGDINGDDRSDMIVASLFSEFLFIAHGRVGGFADPIAVPLGEGDVFMGAGVAGIETGDADDDGDLDVFMLQQRNGELDSLRIARNDGGTLVAQPEAFAVEFSHSFTKPFALSVADINGDNLVDVITTTPNDHVAPIIINQGDLQFELGDELPTANDPVATIAADFDNDEDIDVAVVALHELITAGRVNVFRNMLVDGRCPGSFDVNDDGTVGPADLAMLLGAWGECDRGCCTDFDGDGATGPADLAQLLGAWS